MKKSMPWWLLPWVRITAGLVVLILLGGAVGGVALSQSSPQQPIAFPHNFHVGTGIPCQYCHPGVAWGPTAGLPSAEKCWGCHQQVAKTATSPELQKLAAYVRNGEEIPWVPVFIQPDFVQFNHRPHVAANVECKTCHGDMLKQTVAQPIPRQNMGWCLDCHSKQAPEKWTRLSDCATCHY
jgi:hypothetical protein